MDAGGDIFIKVFSRNNHAMMHPYDSIIFMLAYWSYPQRLAAWYHPWHNSYLPAEKLPDLANKPLHKSCIIYIHFF
jgi:hypothetical protein